MNKIITKQITRSWTSKIEYTSKNELEVLGGTASPYTTSQAHWSSSRYSRLRLLRQPPVSRARSTPRTRAARRHQARRTW